MLGTYYGYVTSDGTTLVEPYFLADSSGWAVALIDVRTGRVLAEHPYTVIGSFSTEMSTDRYAVFQDRTQQDPHISYLDLRTGVAHTRPWPVGAE